MPKHHHHKEKSDPTMGLIIGLVVLCLLGYYWYTNLRYNNKLGGLDVGSYCKSAYGGSSNNYTNNVWNCGTTPLTQTDWNTMCQQQKSNTAAVAFNSDNSKDGWTCYAPSTFSQYLGL